MIDYNYKLFSFDIFDTLLLRPYVNPQEVWKVLEKENGAVGFAAARKQADAATYKLSSEENRETTIEEAYELIPEWKHMMQKEMDLERKVLRANPETLKLWNELGAKKVRRVLVSDMYMSAEFIQSVLRENGFDGWDGFYLSRDYDARKTTGKLFDIMLEKEGVKPSDVLHIGDNIHSDVKMPSSLGISTYHYKKIIDRFFDVCPFAKKIDSHLAGTMAIGWHQYVFDTPNATYWNRLGFVWGGIIGYMYVSWIVKTAKRLGKERLLFVARDGYVWKIICNELYPEVKTEYIYAPRLTSIAVLGAIGSDPWAIKDRQKFIDSHLQDVDLNEIRNNYSEYVASFGICDKDALIDGCSSAFSAQRLVENIVGHDVFTFYLLAMADRNSIGALYQTKLYSIPFQMQSEFLFGSPEPPICDVKDGKPVYTPEPLEPELFKMSISEAIAHGAVACAKILHSEVVEITTAEMPLMVDTFMNHLTEEDVRYLDSAKNAADVEQKMFRGITYTPIKKGFSIIRSGRLGLTIKYCTDTVFHQYDINRLGIHHYKKDISFETEVLRK